MSTNTTPKKDSDTVSQLEAKIQRLEKQKQEIKNYYENMIAQMPDYVYWKDKNARYLGCNNNVAKFLGLNSRHEIIGKSDFDFGWSKKRIAMLKSHDDKVINDGLQINLEEKNPLSDNSGEYTYLYSRKSPLLDDDGNIVGILGISTDITERLRAEEELKQARDRAEAANRAKSDFLATVSHELRTPLNAIIGVAQFLQNTAPNNPYLETINIVDYSAKHLLSLINEILDFEKLEQHTLKLEEEANDLRIILNNIVENYTLQVKEKGIALSLDYPSDVPQYIMTDNLRIKQIIVNLLGNALKFTPKGTIIIRVRSITRNKENVTLQISVADTGIGIPKDQLSNIFNRFTQVESNLSRQHQGIGLGLAITKQLVTLLKGEITVESTPQKGSTFTCTMPFKLAKQDTLLDSNSKNSKTKAVKSQFTILLVEDNVLNQKVASLLLNNMGHTVDIVNNGFEALTKSIEDYDVIFMDIGLPGMDGLATTKRLRQIEAKNQHIPIVAMTAHALSSDHKKCYEAGMDDVLIKPVMEKNLHDIFEKWLT